MNPAQQSEVEEVEKLQAILRQTDAWIHAPPLPEAKRRAELLRRLIDENPEAAVEYQYGGVRIHR